MVDLRGRNDVTACSWLSASLASCILIKSVTTFSIFVFAFEQSQNETNIDAYSFTCQLS